MQILSSELLKYLELFLLTAGIYLFSALSTSYVKNLVNLLTTML